MARRKTQAAKATKSTVPAAVKEAEVKSEAAEVKAAVAEEVKTEEAKAEEVKAEEVKTEEVKAEAAEKKAAAKKTVKKAEMKTSISVQYMGKDISEKEMIGLVKKDWTANKHKIGDIKTMELYVKVEENTVYYVINGDMTGSVEI